MALFQPSNIIPSTFAGITDSTVDVSSNVKISWQVNGTSPMTAFKIVIYNNESLTEIHTEIIKDYNLFPFYGVDNKGNPQQFTYAPTSTTWASWDLTNGNEYKMVITQYWGTNSNTDFTQDIATSVEQWSGTVFLTRAKPTLFLSLTEDGDEWNSETDVGGAVQTFYGNYSQAQNDSINSVRWQIGTVNSISEPITDSNVSILDDTGVINTQVLFYKYNGFFNTNTTDFPKFYAIKCTVQTGNGVEVSTGWTGFNVVYSQATNGGDLNLACQEDSSVLLSWGEALNILGIFSPSEGTPSISGGVLSLSSSESVKWNTVNSESMSLAPNYSVSQKAQIAKYLQKNETIIANPSESYDSKTFVGSPEDFYLWVCELNNSNNFTNVEKTAVIFNGNYGVVATTGDYKLWYSTDNGVSWQRSNDAVLSVWNCLAFANISGQGIFVAASAYSNPSLSNDFVYSTDNGVSWQYATTVIVPSANHCWAEIATSSNMFVACGYRGNVDLNHHAIIAYSYDGAQWAGDTNLPTNIINKNDSLLYSVAYGNNVFVASGCYIDLTQNKTVNYILYSNNGINWVDTDSELFSTTYSNSTNLNYIVSKVLFYNGYFYIYICNEPQSATQKYSDISYGAFYTVYRSSDGITWSSLGATKFKFINIAFNSVFGISDKTIGFSMNGISLYRNIIIDSTDFVSDIADITQSNKKLVVLHKSYLQYSTNEDYFFTEIYNPDLWLNSAKVTTHSDNYATYTYSQNNYNSLTFYVFGNSYEQISAEFSLTYYSKNATGSLTVNTNYDISAIDLISLSPSDSTTVDISLATNSYTLTVTTPTLSGYSYDNPVNATIQIVYDLNLADGQTVIKTNNLSFDFQLGDDGNPYQYGLLVKDGSNNTIVPEFKIQPTNGTYTLNYKFLLTPTKIYFILIDDNNNLLGSYEQDITSTQTAITEISMAGKQVIDWLYIRQNGDILTADYTPIWDNTTLFLADFIEEGVEGLQAGTSSAGALTNYIYRFNIDKQLLQPIFDIPTQYNQLKDYGVKSLNRYYYELFYLSGTSFSVPAQSDKVCRQFKGYYLIEATQYDTEINDYPNVYHVVKVWRFQNNVSTSAISNNNTPNWLTNFTQYRLRQPSARLGESGTLEALLSNYDIKTNTYIDTAEMMKDLKEASVSNNTFFLKDMKGNLYMVGISAPITQTINIKTKLQEVTISVPWEEVGDATNVSLIQTPTDSGWQGNN